ncbi:unnamed protein product [Vitrella brassicaformis CCMP3155]|uniref:2-isopropylmalate synthase n=1 Tax=Vitrella brassicaformis (strain CCMP3155) TaxID=1169540 RepID=A0A0G4FV81_VITBC|nr:unnamed protein product [Vitrella brassicaformis CCMP3155]|eukprot:CEM18958.1 unnamed protein product [Vitrella brassicaformis CCMP3155]
MPTDKYRPFPAVPFDDKWTRRTWPEQTISRAPRWCSVDLRDGNQALINPMSMEKKMKFFLHLVKMGYKEIEVGFPSASQIDFDFCRRIIDEGLVPDDVWVSVLVQAREHLIRRTIEAVKGSKRCLIHIYNSTSTLQREVVFKMDREGIKKLAVEGTTLIRSLAKEQLQADGTRVRLEYSPESFTGTELDFALDVCHAVMEAWEPTEEDPIIFNLPATVEMASPNVYADQIEWMHTHFKDRSKILLSLHPHNDRGTAVAAAELGMMAGADRVEGCLFGNGERTGNVCLVTLAMNLFSQGVDPEVDLSDIQRSIEVAEYCNELAVPERWPWAGALVYTAFSGSHQDAIKKGMTEMSRQSAPVWAVPYLPIDPKDIGRSYEAIVRINSQSGKGGVAFIMEKEYGVAMPRDMQMEFSREIQVVTDSTAREISPAEIFAVFHLVYLDPVESGGNGLFQLIDYSFTRQSHIKKSPQLPTRTVNAPAANGVHNGVGAGHVNGDKALSRHTAASSDLEITAEVMHNGRAVTVTGRGNGPISAFIDALNGHVGGERAYEVTAYHQEAVGKGSSAAAICFVQLKSAITGREKRFGVGIDTNVSTAGLKAICSAANHLGRVERGDRAYITVEQVKQKVSSLPPNRPLHFDQGP